MKLWCLILAIVLSGQVSKPAIHTLSAETAPKEIETLPKCESWEVPMIKGDTIVCVLDDNVPDHYPSCQYNWGAEEICTVQI